MVPAVERRSRQIADRVAACTEIDVAGQRAVVAGVFPQRNRRVVAMPLNADTVPCS